MSDVHGSEPAEAPAPEGGTGRLVGTAITGFALFLMAIFGWNNLKDGSEKAAKERNAARDAAYQAAVADQVARASEAGKQPTLYTFADYPNGCYERDMKTYDFYVYPKGGPVKAWPPKGEPYVDIPGIDKKTGYGPGRWRWCPDKDSRATGVEIWE